MIGSAFESGVAKIRLERGEKRNALTPLMLSELALAIQSVPAEAGALLVSGDGPVFCAGFDLKLCASDPSGNTMRSLLSGLSKNIRALKAIPMPVVFAVHGGAIAGGCALLGGADIVIAADCTDFGYPVSLIGVSPAVSAPFLASAVGHGPARRMLLDPGLIDAAGAKQMGLIHEIVDSPTAAFERGLARAGQIEAKPRIGVRSTKSLCNRLGSPTTDHALAALEVSCSLTGGPEETELLAKMWGSPKTNPRD